MDFKKNYFQPFQVIFYEGDRKKKESLDVCQDSLKSQDVKM